MGLRASLSACALAGLSVAGPVTSAATPATRAGRCEVVTIEAPAVRAASISNILYLNRCIGGCSVTKGGDDSRTNTSSIPKIDSGDSVILEEWNNGDAVWAATVECVREVLLPYNVVITEDDPGPNTNHHESMIGGTAANFGLDATIAGISPMAGDCSPLNNLISFSFANGYGDDDPYAHCWTIVHEAGHAFGLEHVYECRDAMTYLVNCGRKFFRNEALACAEEGEDEPWVETSCRCDNPQNTHEKLLRVFGEGVGAAAPITTIPLPAPDDEVRHQFVVYALVEDPRGVSHIKLYINGTRWLDLVVVDDDPGPHPLRTAAELPDGYLDLEVRGFNDLELPGSAFVSVLKGEPCTSAAACLDDQSCDDGRCSWPAPSVAFGEECERWADCISEICATHDGVKLCTTECVTGDDCPNDYACFDDGLCRPGVGGGGCCRVGGRGPRGADTLLLLGLVALLRFRRRR